MRVTYDPEADALYMEFRGGVAADNVDLAPASSPTSTGGGACSASRFSTLRVTFGRSWPALPPVSAGGEATRPRQGVPAAVDTARIASQAGRDHPKDVDREVTAHRADR